MNRRTLLGACVGCAWGFPSCVENAPAATAERRRGRPLIGRLTEGGPADLTVFRDAMRALGHPDIAIEERPAHGNANSLAGLAAELVALKVDVIWSTGSVATQAAKDATSTIPIVMVAADALRGGLIDNLARPGGNLTGLTLVGTELAAKRIELRRLYPGVQRVIALAHGPGAETVPIVVDWLQRSQAAADALRIGFRFVELSPNPTEWDREIGALATPPRTALTVMESPFLLLQRSILAEVTLKHRLPAVYAFPEHVQAGGLFSYGVTSRYIHQRAAFYVSRILRGSDPGDLPGEQPTRYDLAINRATAQALGLTIPRSVLVSADHVLG